MSSRSVTVGPRTRAARVHREHLRVGHGRASGTSCNAPSQVRIEKTYGLACPLRWLEHPWALGIDPLPAAEAEPLVMWRFLRDLKGRHVVQEPRADKPKQDACCCAL